MFGEWLIHHLVRKSCIIYLLIGSSSLSTSFPQNVNSQFPTPTFEYLSSEDGLPENSVTCILQDHLGYLWLGTLNGLVRYDGYLMKVFQHDKNDSSSISNSSISAIYEDKNKTLWIGTWDGLNKFNRYNETFISYKHNEKDKNSINDNWIRSLYEDNSGRFWVGTNKGLNLFENKEQIFISYYLTDPEGKNHLPINAIIKEPVSEYLLIGTGKIGLWRFNIKKKVFSKYKFITEGNHEKEIGTIQSFYKSKDRKIWMAS